MRDAINTGHFFKVNALSRIIGCALLVNAALCHAQGVESDDIKHREGEVNRSGQCTQSSLESLDIRLSDKLVSVNVNNVPMRCVLRKLSIESGVQTRVFDKVRSREITANFYKLPLDEAYRRLLLGENYIMMNDSKGGPSAVTRVYILPLGMGQFDGQIEVHSAKETLNQSKPMLNNLRASESEMLATVISSDSIPDNIKEAIINQVSSRSGELTKTVSAQRNQAIYKLIERIEKTGGAAPETIGKLHEEYEKQNAQE